MVNLVLGIVLVTAQLTTLGGGLPQVVEAEYASRSVAVGRDAEVVMKLDVRDGYLINHTPPMQLKLRPVPGLELVETSLVSDPLDPNSTDVYYVNVPDFRFGVKAAAAGRYDVPGELVYFFCSKADGFCARQTLDVVVPVVAE